MKSDIDLKAYKAKLSNLVKVESKHAAFLATLIVLVAYIFIVWQISTLAVAEPSDSDAAAAETQIPKVDKNAINQIQSLEQNSSDIHSLFNDARNNPFQE